MRAPAVVVLCLLLSAGSAVELCGGGRGLGTCLRLRVVRLLDRALRSGPLRLSDDLAISPDPGAETRAGRALSADEIAAGLPRGREDAALDRMILDKITSFIKSRSISIRLMSDDEFTEIQGRKSDGGGDDKSKDGMMFAMFGSMFVKMGLLKLGLLAGKALIVSKMALFLSAIIGLKSLLSDDKESTQVIYASGGHDSGHGEWRRSGIVYPALVRPISR